MFIFTDEFQVYFFGNKKHRKQILKTMRHTTRIEVYRTRRNMYHLYNVCSSTTKQNIPLIKILRQDYIALSVLQNENIMFPR